MDVNVLWDGLVAAGERKLVKFSHGPHGLVTVNYTNSVQIHPDLWTPIISLARGIVFRIIDHQDSHRESSQHPSVRIGQVVVLIATPYPKFFNFKTNIGEDGVIFTDDEIESISTANKLDGSLAIIFRNDIPGALIDDEDTPALTVCTKGSFTSPQAVWAKEWLDQNIDPSSFIPGWTYLAEIIFPENRIVVRYGDRSEVCLLNVYTRSGEDLPFENIQDISERTGLNLVDSHTPHDSMADLISFLGEVKNQTTGQEGVVISYRLVSGGVHRHKCKSLEYASLHKSRSVVTIKSVYDHIRKGTFDKYRDTVDEEDIASVDEFKSQLEQKYTELEEEITKVYLEAGSPCMSDLNNALNGITYPKHFKSILFLIAKEQDIEGHLWKLVGKTI
ncbi:MAG: hypothetical protein JKX76_01135 [Colwellia sp.]|nr:hypothetical protein [Colwellia sp.]